MKKDDSDEEEFTDLEKELWEISNDLFDEEVWSKQTREEMKDLSRKELSRIMFGFGFIMYQKIMDEQIKGMEEKIRDNPEFAKESLESLNKKSR
ncbi:MAG: hypothetical protein AABW41_04375 [Nanoarchaeota archaeon]